MRSRGEWAAASLFVLIAFSTGCDDDGTDEPCVVVRHETGDRRYCRAELLGRDDQRKVILRDHPIYRRQGPMEVKVIPLSALLDLPFDEGDVLDVQGADGFSAPLDPTRLIRGLSSGATAYLAIEEAEAPWPSLGVGRPSPGPFAIVWTDAGDGAVSAEEWPYQVVAITFAPPLTERYPELMPATSIPIGDPIRHGLDVFVEHCMPCHRLHGAGAAEMGPDLNAPMSPTEYMTEEGLRRLIRDPRSVRTWPASQMPATSEDELPDEDLDALIAYLSHMAGRRGR